MTRRISFIVATAGAALVVAAPAFGDNSTNARQGPGSLAVSPAVFEATVSADNPSSDRLGPGSLAISPEVYESTVLGLSDELTTVLDARREALGRSYQLGDFAVNNTWAIALGESGVQSNPDFGQNFLYPSGYPESGYGRVSPTDSLDRALISSSGNSVGDAHERGTVPSSTANQGPADVVSGYQDSFTRVDIPTNPVGSQPTASPSDDIQWPELGIGFAVGMALLLGLILTVRYSRSQPLAH